MMATSVTSSAPTVVAPGITNGLVPTAVGTRAGTATLTFTFSSGLSASVIITVS